MHTYEAVGPEDELEELPDIGTFRFNDALDVVEWARRDRTIGWRTWPEVWHLDDEGRFTCSSRGDSLDSIRSWAKKLGSLEVGRREGVADGGCAPRWLIIESRPLLRTEGTTVDERDAQCFLTLRRKMVRLGVVVVDAMIFDDECHWWSLHELTSGSTRWSAQVTAS